MAGKNNNLLKRIKQGTRVETFGIKKFKAGAASVLIGASIFFGAGVASAADQDAQSNDNKTELAADDESDSAKAEKAEATTATSTNEVATTEATSKNEETSKEVALNKTDLEKLINDVKSNLENGIYDNKTEESLSKLNELMLNAEVVVKDATTQEAIDKAKDELEKFIMTGLVDKKAEVKDEAKSEAKVDSKDAEKTEENLDAKAENKEEAKSEEKVDSKEETKSEEKVDSKEETKSEEATSTKAETTVAEEKTALDQLVSEAQVLSDRATNYAAKVTDSAAAQAVTQSAQAVKEEVAKALDVIKNDEATKDDVTKKSAELRSAIEAVATNLRRAGLENIDAVLADEATITTAIVPPKTKVPVANVKKLTEEEVRAIIKEVRAANPTLTEEDKITVVADRSNTDGIAGQTTVTLASGQTVTFNANDVVMGTATRQNLDQLKLAINWFDFASATITYPDGTVAGPAKLLDTPKDYVITYPNGQKVTTKIKYQREITYKDGSKDVSTSDAFLAKGIAKYTEHLYYGGGAQNDHEAYEVLQVGMQFQVPTEVKGYELTATVTSLAPKDVATDRIKEENGGVAKNAVRDYGNWDASNPVIQADKQRVENNRTAVEANRNVVTTNGSKISETLPDYPTGEYNGEMEIRNQVKAYIDAVKKYNDAVDAYNAANPTNQAVKLNTSISGVQYVNIGGKAVPEGSAGLYTKIQGDNSADILLTTQDEKFSYMRQAGLSTIKDGKEQLTAFTSSRDESNVGVTFSLSATYNDRPVEVNVIAVDAEEAGSPEFLQFHTDGTPWEQFMSLNIDKEGGNGVVPNVEASYANNRFSTGAGYKASEWVNKDANGNVTVYGTQDFGPNVTAMSTKNDLPIGISRNVSTLSIYLNSQGAQAGTIGFVIYDGGDAPASFGSAQHIIGNFNKTVDGKKVVASQPFLGDQPADPDFRNTTTDPNAAWNLDDTINSEEYQSFALVSGQTTVTNQSGDTGIYTISGANAVITKADGTTVAIKTGDILSASFVYQNIDDFKNSTSHIASAEELANPDVQKFPTTGIYNHAKRSIGVGNLPDEGEGQLLDSKVATKYTLRQATDTQYVFEGVKMNRGVNNDKAYVRAFVDFNGNGKFDLDEGSDVVEVNQDGTYNIVFNNTLNY